MGVSRQPQVLPAAARSPYLRAGAKPPPRGMRLPSPQFARCRLHQRRCHLGGPAAAGGAPRPRHGTRKSGSTILASSRPPRATAGSARARRPRRGHYLLRRRPPECTLSLCARNKPCTSRSWPREWRSCPRRPNASWPTCNPPRLAPCSAFGVLRAWPADGAFAPTVKIGHVQAATGRRKATASPPTRR